MIIHLVDGTYELYRQFYGQARHSSKRLAAVDGVIASTRRLIAEKTGPVGVATDHVIESFRNELFDGYKKSEGMEPEILEQIPILEERLIDIGVTVWPMVDVEADDALASAARIATQDASVHQVRIYSPDKDLAQCVTGRRVVQVDRRQDKIIDELAVQQKFGVAPTQIPDYLALVGDSADGIPGIDGCGPKSAARIINTFGNVLSIPDNSGQWTDRQLHIRNGEEMCRRIAEEYDQINLYFLLATLITTLEIRINF